VSCINYVFVIHSLVPITFELWVSSHILYVQE